MWADANLFKDAFLKAQQDNEALFNKAAEAEAQEDAKFRATDLHSQAFV